VNQQARSNSMPVAEVASTNPNHSPSGRLAASPGLQPEPEGPSTEVVGGEVVGVDDEVVADCTVVVAPVVVDVLSAIGGVVVADDGSGLSASPLHEASRTALSTAAVTSLPTLRYNAALGCSLMADL
jgi:hypothetical protein